MVIGSNELPSSLNPTLGALSMRLNFKWLLCEYQGRQHTRVCPVSPGMKHKRKLWYPGQPKWHKASALYHFHSGWLCSNVFQDTLKDITVEQIWSKLKRNPLLFAKEILFLIRALAQYCSDACREQTCEGEVQLGAIVKQQQEEEKDGESWEAGTNI